MKLWRRNFGQPTLTLNPNPNPNPNPDPTPNPDGFHAPAVWWSSTATNAGAWRCAPSNACTKSPPSARLSGSTRSRTRTCVRVGLKWVRVSRTNEGPHVRGCRRAEDKTEGFRAQCSKHPAQKAAPPQVGLGMTERAPVVGRVVAAAARRLLDARRHLRVASRACGEVHGGCGVRVAPRRVRRVDLRLMVVHWVVALVVVHVAEERLRIGSSGSAPLPIRTR